jgi:hypothetical protein
MADPDFHHLDAELAHLLGPGTAEPGAPAESESPGAPALLIRRAKNLTEPLLGKRARFLMTSYTPDGEWLANGWTDGLRVVSEPVTDVARIAEPAVWVQEERDYYGDLATAGRFAVGISRVWIEQYVASTSTADELATRWLENLNRNPNLPELRPLLPIQGHPDPVGARVVLIGDGLETDLRAVGPVRMTDNGELAVTVIAERDWYRWARNYPAEPHPSLRWVPAARVWVE